MITSTTALSVQHRKADEIERKLKKHEIKYENEGVTIISDANTKILSIRLDEGGWSDSLWRILIENAFLRSHELADEYRMPFLEVIWPQEAKAKQDAVEHSMYIQEQLSLCTILYDNGGVVAIYDLNRKPIEIIPNPPFFNSSLEDREKMLLNAARVCYRRSTELQRGVIEQISGEYELKKRGEEFTPISNLMKLVPVKESNET